MFENKDFEIDEFSQEYLALHPNISTYKRSLLEEHFETVMEDDQSISGSDVSESSEAEDANDNKSRGKLRVPRFYEMKDERHAEAFSKGASLAEEISLPMGQRVRKEQQRALYASKHDVKLGEGGSREISFNPRSSKKYVEDNEDKETRRGKRGIQSLNLRDGSGYRGREEGAFVGEVEVDVEEEDEGVNELDHVWRKFCCSD